MVSTREPCGLSSHAPKKLKKIRSLCMKTSWLRLLGSKLAQFFLQNGMQIYSKITGQHTVKLRLWRAAFLAAEEPVSKKHTPTYFILYEKKQQQQQQTIILSGCWCKPI